MQAADDSQPCANGLMQQCAPAARRGSCCTGIQISGGSLRKVSPKKPGGVTPITVNGCPSTTKLEPTTEGSAPYSACQVWWLMMATGGADGLSSSGESRRPPNAFTPSVEK